MCHHFEAVEELSEAEREEIRESHDSEELRAELTEADLQKLGVEA